MIEESKHSNGRHSNDSRSHFISEGDARPGSSCSFLFLHFLLLTRQYGIPSHSPLIGATFEKNQVNEEIEANIQVTQEIESSIVKCEEIEADLETKEAELVKTSGMLQFETVGYVTVAGKFGIELLIVEASVEISFGQIKCIEL